MLMVANRNSRASWISRRSPQQDGDTPYELVAVCMWSVLGVALVALVLWLALGGDDLIRCYPIENYFNFGFVLPEYTL